MKEKLGLSVWGLTFTLAIFVSGLFSWFTPLPLFYIGRKYSVRFALMLWLVFLALIVFGYTFLLGFFGIKENSLLQWFTWLPGMVYYKSFGAGVVLKAIAVYFAFNISCSVLLCWRSREERNITKLASQVSLGVCLATFLTLIFCVGLGHFQVFYEFLLKYSREVLEQVLVFNRSSGVSGDELLFIQQNKEAIAKTFVKLLPGLMVSILIFLVWINLYLARRLFQVFGFFKKVQELILFRISFAGVWSVIVSLALYLLNLYIWKIEALSFVLFNFWIVFSTLYFLQGLAILSFFLLTRRLALWLRFLCYLLVFIFIQPLGILLMGLGFFDSWYDFRRLNIRKV